MTASATLPRSPTLPIKRIVGAIVLVLAAGIGFFLGGIESKRMIASHRVPSQSIEPKGFAGVDNFAALQLPFPAIPQDRNKPKQSSPNLSG